MNNESYHADPAISKSHLDAINLSPLHYWSRFLDPQRQPLAPTAAMEFGTAVHAALLEPQLFGQAYKRAPDCSRTTKAGKELWAEAAADGKKLIKPDEWDQIDQICQSVAGHPTASKLLGMQGQAELSLFAQDPTTGLRVKCRPDYLTDSGWLIDVKTTMDASLRGFQRAIANYRYHVQAGYYSYVTRLSQGVTPRGFLFIAIEKTRPYAVQVFKCTPSLLDTGLLEAKRNLQMLREAFDEHPIDSPWPGYSLNPVEIDLPSWLNGPTPPSLETY